ncbi:hypothetical protein LCL97_02250 [Seohaeicola saemankumensis]|nr:hypothetical protein [Seohaeicola saemankumensis]MCA0869637.1 hypothetical protein [Seohaeicola saemankumensis]
MKRSIVTLFSAACLLAAPVLAQDMKGRGYEINPVNDHVFEAVSEGLHGGAAFWCVASLFVQQKLKAPMSTEIYVVRGGGPSVTTNRRSAAQFTIDPAAAGVTPSESGGNLNKLVVGEHMSVSRGRTFCS